MKRGAAIAIAAAALVIVLALSLVVGARPVGLSTVIDAVTGFDPQNGDHAVVLSRVPRTVAGLTAGAALGVAGAAMQGLARNPLADPGILGLNAGSALAIVIAIWIFGVSAASGYIWFAFIGAAVAAVIVYAVATIGREGATPVKLALAGAALNAGLLSLLNGLLVVGPDTFDAFRFWQVGSFSGRDWDVVVPVLPFLAVGLVISLATGPVLNGLALGDDVARGLGQRVGLTRAITAVGAVILCGSATAMVGPIAFVGLVVPHAARVLVGPDYRAVLPLSMLLAPVLMLAADVVGRVLLPPAEIQVGVMTAVLGAPVFIALIRRRKQVAL